MHALAPYVAVGVVLVLFVGVVSAVVLSFMVLRNGGECEFKARALSLAVDLRVSKDEGGPGI